MPRSHHRSRPQRRKLIVLSFVALSLAALGVIGWRLLIAPDVSQYFSNAETARKAGDLAAAVIDYKNVLQRDPAHREARWRLGQVYIGLKQPSFALSELQDAMPLATEHPEIHLDIAVVLLELGKYREALTEIQKYRGPRSADAAALEAQAKIGLGEKKAAKSVIETAAKSAPDAASLHLATARLAISEGDLTGAANAVALALATTPNDPDALVLSGTIALARSELAGAETAFRTAYELAPNKTEAGSGLAEVLLKTKKFDEAKAVIDALAKANPGTVGAEYLKGWYAYAQKQWAQAETHLLQVIKVAPEHPQALLMLADSAYVQKKFNQAENYLKTFDQHNPGQAAAHRLLGAVYLKQHRTDDAIKALEPFADLEPPDSGLLSLLSYAYSIAGDHAKGKAVLKRAQALAPDSPTLQAQQAVGEIAGGESTTGIANLEKLAATAPGSVQPRQLLTLAHLQRGDEQAVDSAADLVAINPKDPLAHNLLGVALLKAGDQTGARKAFDAALALDPEFAPALANLGFLAISDNQIAEGKIKLQAAWAADKTYTAAGLALAHLADRDGQPDEARRLLEEASAAQPNAPAPRWLLADRLLNAGRRREAIELAETAFQLSPKLTANRLQMGVFQLQTNQAEAAYKTFSALRAELGPASPATLYLAEAARATGRLDEARKHYQVSSAANPSSPEVMWAVFATELAAKDYVAADAIVSKLEKLDAATGEAARGHLAAARGDQATAVESYRAALELKPGVGAFLRYVTAVARQGDKSAVRTAYADWFLKHPEDVTSRLNLGAFELANNDRAAALVAFEDVLAYSPEHPVAMNNLAWLYDEAGDDRAREFAEKAHNLLPDSPETTDTLGWILVRQDELRRGIELLEQAYTARRKDPNIGYHYAYALAESGAKDRASEILTEILVGDRKFNSVNGARALQRRLAKGLVEDPTRLEF